MAVAVGKFDNRSSDMRGVFSDGVDRLGSQAKTTLIAHLQESQRCAVQDRDNLSEPGQEAQLRGAAQTLRGAAFVVTGDVTEFRQNGVVSANEAQDIPLPKLREVFGADAAVYIRVKRYGTGYAVLASETRVEVEARIVDLRSGEQLWRGEAMATSAEQQQAQGGLVALLVTAIVNQIVGTATDASYRYAGIADQRPLTPQRDNGVLHGPRSPNFGKPPTTAP